MERQAKFRRVLYPLDRARNTRVGSLLERTIRNFTRTDGTIYAAAITYYLLLSIFPLLVIVAAVLGLLARDPGYKAQVIDQITSLLPSGSGVRDEVDQLVQDVARPSSGLVGLAAFLGALWSASGVFSALRRALNRTFDVPMKRSYIRGRLRDLVSVISVVLLLIASTTLTALLAIVRNFLNRWFHGVTADIGWGLVFFLLPLVFSFVTFLLVYRLIPNHTLRWRELWVGALVAAVGFELAKVLFTLYLTTFASYDEVYGALGSLIALLVFVFIASNITILGAGFASELSKDRMARDPGLGIRDARSG